MAFEQRRRDLVPRALVPAHAAAAVLSGAGQLVWAPGTANLVYAAGGSSLAVSSDGGATFADVMPMPTGRLPAGQPRRGRRHAGRRLTPPVVYALAGPQIFVSFDAGVTWIKDGGTIPSHIGGGVGPFNSQNERVMVVSPRSPLEVFVTGNANLAPPELWRGDYLQFLGTHTSQWEPVPLPNMGQQFSGNVFVAATLPGHGDALFYGPQRSQTFAAPLDPASAADWHALDSSHTHVDLHGIFLSPDFEATFQDGAYQSSAGTVWLASDGGIFRSTDGGNNFHAAGSISTLSVGEHRRRGARGPGPGHLAEHRRQRRLRHLGRRAVLAPAELRRRRQRLLLVRSAAAALDARLHAALERERRLRRGWPGADAGAVRGRHRQPARHQLSGDRQGDSGPPLRPGSTLWNATSGFAIRGFRPIVRNLPGDDPAQPGRLCRHPLLRQLQLARPHMPNNLAILLRARNIRDDHEAHRLGHAGRLAGREASAPARRPHRRRPRGHRRVRRCRRVDRAEHVRRLVRGSAFRAGRPRFRARAGGSTSTCGCWPTSPATATRTSSAFGDAGVVRGAAATATARSPSRRCPWSPTSASTRAGGSTSTRDSSPTSPATAVPTSSGSATPACTSRCSNGDGTFQFTPVPVLADFGYEAGGWRVEQAPAVPRRCHRRRPRRHRRLRRRRRVRRAQQRRRHVPAAAFRDQRLRLRPGLAGREARAVAGRHHR